MTKALCGHCGSPFELDASLGLVEVDERCLEAMRQVMGASPGTLPCPGNQQSHCIPACLVWTERATQGEVFEGGPWAEGTPVADRLADLASRTLHFHASLGELRSALDARCVLHLKTLGDAWNFPDPQEQHLWFDQNYLRFGAEVHVAAMLACEGLLSVQIQDCNDYEMDAVLGRLQAMACLSMCKT